MKGWVEVLEKYRHYMTLLLQGGIGSAADRSIAQMAGYLEEAWAWGFDVDVWRAHLNPLTWPEVRLQLLSPMLESSPK